MQSELHIRFNIMNSCIMFMSQLFDTPRIELHITSNKDAGHTLLEERDIEWRIRNWTAKQPDVEFVKCSENLNFLIKNMFTVYSVMFLFSA